MPSLSVLIKPASSLCNLRCQYCFYADVSDLRQVRSYGIMSEATAHTVIDRALEALPSGDLQIAFQGGEPTLAGLPFFRDFVAYAEERTPPTVRIRYSIQTNGMVIDGEWARFLAEYHFLVGLSLDGEEYWQDECRKAPGGGGSYARVLEAVSHLREAGADFNILTVLTARSAAHPRALWNFYRKNRFDFVQIIPCLAPLENPRENDYYTLTPQAYGSFLKQFFAIWAKELYAGNYISVRLFDNFVRMAMGEHPEQCGLAGVCSPQFVIEADGGVYPCDFYVLDEYRCGSVNEHSFSELYRAEPMQRFLTEGARRLPQCRSCPAFRVCGGGCRRYRSLYFLEKGYCPHRDFLESCRDEICKVARFVQERN
ncbi:MAG: SPASM domain-containing protein [Clostridia bacterium]|nr:SPASM domain-containing protein [Clostridia bacterium]